MATLSKRIRRLGMWGAFPELREWGTPGVPAPPPKPPEVPRQAQGPRGYQRPDSRILEDVCDEVMHMHDLDSGDVEVRVDKGEVFLTGTVPERWMKQRIEEAADRVRGVKDITNQLRVKRDDPEVMGSE